MTRGWCRGGGLGDAFVNEAGGFVAAIGRPVAVGLRVRGRAPGEGGGSGRDGGDGGGYLWAVDQEKGVEVGSGILMNLGHSLERMLTMERGVFEKKLLLREAEAPAGDAAADAAAPASDTDVATPAAPDDGSTFYHYTTVGAFLLRAQIDARHATNGSVFDIKTRATAAVRYDADNYAAHARAAPARIDGRSRSYAREFYDLTRSAMLKYALQLRIGRMDGALLAYHNTGSVLAFEYVRLAEMDAYVFGSAAFADAAFRAVAAAAEVVCRLAVDGALGRATAAAAAADGDRLKVVVEPLRSRRSVAVYVQRVRGGVDPVGPDAFREHFVKAPRKVRRHRESAGAAGSPSAGAISRAAAAGGDGPSPVGAGGPTDGLFPSPAWCDDDGVVAAPRAGDFADDVGPSAFAVVAPRGGGRRSSCSSYSSSSSHTDTDDADDAPASVAEAHAEADAAAAGAGTSADLPAAWRETPPVAEVDLAAWELRLTPVVNGRPTTDAVSLADGDAYEVLSRLTPVPVDRAVVLDYLDALKRAYYYKNPRLREHAWKFEEEGVGGGG